MNNSSMMFFSITKLFFGIFLLIYAITLFSLLYEKEMESRKNNLHIYRKQISLRCLVFLWVLTLESSVFSIHSAFDLFLFSIKTDQFEWEFLFFVMTALSTFFSLSFLKNIILAQGQKRQEKQNIDERNKSILIKLVLSKLDLVLLKTNPKAFSELKEALELCSQKELECVECEIDKI